MVKNMVFLIAASIFSAVCFCQNSGKLTLNKGEKYVIENKISATSVQEIMGQSMDSKIEFFTTNNIEVKDVNNDKYTLNTTYTKITATINAMGQDMNFDSDKKEDMDGEMGSGMKDLIGQPKNVIIDRNGKIAKGNTDTASRPDGGMMSMMLKQVLGSPEETGYGLSEAFMIIPAKANAGFTWQDSLSTEGIKKFTTYTIKEIKGKEAVVTISGTLDVDSKTEMQGQEIGSKSSGTVSGEQVVDINTGLIKQRNTSMQSSGKVTMMGQEIPTTANITAVSTMRSM